MKLFLQIIANLCVAAYNFGKKIVQIILFFLKRVTKSIKLMSVLEKRLAIAFFVIALALFGVKAKQDFSERTKTVAGNGGTYKEAVVGDFKYFSPILASTDAEKSTSKLIFSGLVKFDKDNNVLPDLADRWEISSDGLKYTFYLKDNVSFHDGQKLTANDVISTVNKIKDPSLKSPLYSAWADVNVSSNAENIVTFELPRAYGPFIYNCDFGVIPAHLSDDQFSKKVTGTGPYKFKNSKTKNGKIIAVYLDRNDKYFGGNPHISKIELDFFKDGEEAKSTFLDDKSYTAMSGETAVSDGVKKWNFETTKRLGLIFNLRVEKLKDKALRQLILGDQKSQQSVDISLTTQDSPLQRAKAEELKKSFAARNINLNIKYHNSVDMQDVLARHDYELLLYGFDFGNDRDPYVFWHSSQADKLNFAGYSDKNSDILLEDARMITDYSQRNAKYDQFFTLVKSEALGTFYDPIEFKYNFRTNLKGVVLNCNDVDFRYSGIEKWYLNEKRVKK